jgi:hypothetical protein
VATLFNVAGDQVPTILFVDVVGNDGILCPLQYGPTCANVGAMFGLTVTVADPVTGLEQLPTATPVNAYTNEPVTDVGAAKVTLELVPTVVIVCAAPPLIVYVNVYGGVELDPVNVMFG